MEWSNVETHWDRLGGILKQTWGKLTDDDLAEIDGRYDRMVAKLQERYDVAREDAQAMLTDGLQREGIQGEGNYTAAKKYQEAQHKFAADDDRSDSGKES